MKKYFSIGETSRLSGATIKALRFYDSIGLLRPRWTDPETGYRYYSIDQFFTIEMIGYCKNLGVPIKVMKKLFDKNDADLFLDFFAEQRNEAAKQILHLNKAIMKMEKLEKEIGGAKEISREENVYRSEFPERTVLTRECETQHDDEDTHLKYLDIYKEIVRNGLVTVYQTGSTADIDIERGTLEYRKIFTEVHFSEDSVPIPTERLPGGSYICVNYFAGNRQTQIGKLTRYLKENELSPKLVVEAETFLDVLGCSNPLMELQVLL